MQQEFANTNGVGAGAHVTQSSVAGTSAMRDFHIPHPAPIIAIQHTVKEFEKKDEKDRAVIGAVGTAAFAFNAPMLLDFATALLTKVLTLNGAIGGKWAAGVHKNLRAIPRALRTTELRDMGSFWERVKLKRYEFDNRFVGNSKLEDWYQNKGIKIERKSAKVEGSKFGEAIQGWFDRRVAKGGVFAKIDGKIAEFANWRSGRLHKSGMSHIVGADGKLDLDARMGKQTLEKKPNWIQRTFSGEKTATTYTVDYADATETVKQLKTADAEQAGDLVRKAQDQIRQVGAQAKDADANRHVFDGRRALNLAAERLEAAAGYKNIADKKTGSAMGKMLRALPKASGRASILYAALGVGSALTVAAKWMDLGRDTKLEKSLIKEFAADVYGVPAEQVTKEMMLGKDAHPLVKQAAETALKAKGGRGVYGALNAGFEVVNVATLKGLGGVGFAPMLWYGAPGMSNAALEPLANNMLIGENSSIKAYQQLKDADSGKVQLPPEGRVALVRFMIASIPGIAQNMGADNRLVEPMAEALVSKGLNARQTLQAIANPEQMTALAREATETLAKKAEEAKKAAAAKKNAAPEAAAQKTKELPSMHMAAAPAKQVSMAEASHEGMVETRQKAQSH
ncbi:MAG: hypothetical protein ACOYJ2_00685 [Rickettsiales bacterium]